MDDLAIEHHDDPVRKLEQFIEVFADKQYRRTPVTGFDQARVDLRDRGEIQTKTRVGRNQDGNVLGHLAREHYALYIAARQRRDGCAR